MHLIFIVLLGITPLRLWPYIYTSYLSRDTLIVGASNYMFSIVCTLMVAGFTGYLAALKEVDINGLVDSGKLTRHIVTQTCAVEHYLNTFKMWIPISFTYTPSHKILSEMFDGPSLPGNAVEAHQPQQCEQTVGYQLWGFIVGSVKTTIRISYVQTFVTYLGISLIQICSGIPRAQFSRVSLYIKLAEVYVCLQAVSWSFHFNRQDSQNINIY